MTSPSANDIDTNNNANNNANNAPTNVPYYNNTNSFLTTAAAATTSQRRNLVPPLALINETELPPGFEPFEIQTFLNIIDLINPLMISIPPNINEN